MSAVGFEGSSAAADISVELEAGVKALPHSGQNMAGSRTAAPHEQRVEISGCMESIVDCQLPIADFKSLFPLSR